MTPTVELQRRIHGLDVHVRLVGDGPPVLLINGIGTHTGTWAALEAALPDLRLIEYDAPGSGRSATPRIPRTIPALARLAAGVLDAAGVEQADVVGYSLGGIVAQQLAARSPERVRRLVLAATGCGWGAIPGDLRAMREIAVPTQRAARALYHRSLGDLVGGRARRDTAWVDELWQTRMHAPPTTGGYLGQLFAVAAWSTLPALGRIRHPTLVVAGGDDPVSPAANAVLLAERIPNARLRMAPDEGHLLLMDERSSTLPWIREFLTAERLEAAAVWDRAQVVPEQLVRDALAGAGRRGWPALAISSLLRRRGPVHRS